MTVPSSATNNDQPFLLEAKSLELATLGVDLQFSDGMDSDIRTDLISDPWHCSAKAW